MAQTRNLIGSFANVDETDGEDFLGRLDIMSSLDIFREYKRHTFGLMRPKNGARMADIGCGTGDDARAMTDIVGETGRVTGFDISETMIAEARKRHEALNGQLSFVRSGAENLDCVDHCFDAVRADRVFLHVPSPRDAVREAMRVTKPGGRIVISEPDMRSLWVTTQLPDVAESIFDGIARSTAHPVIARDLYHLLVDMELQDISLELRPLVYSDPDIGERILNFSVIAQTLVNTDRLSHKDMLEFLSDLQERESSGRFLGGITLFIVSATIPT